MLLKTNGFFDGMMQRGEAKAYVNKNGRNAFLNYLNDQYPNYDLGGFSTSWEESPEYICKARGKYGDVIIGWMENDY